MPDQLEFGDLKVSLEAWDPKFYDPKTEDGKCPKQANDLPAATPWASPKDLDGHRPATLKEVYFKDEDYFCLQFLSRSDKVIHFYLMKAGEGYFTPEYHITQRPWEEERDRILAKWKEEDSKSKDDHSGQSSPLSNVPSSELVGPDPLARINGDPKILALQQRAVDATPRPIALRVSVKFTNKSFKPSLHNSNILPEFRNLPPDLCVNIFYNGEFVHSRIVNNRFKPKADDEYIERAFSGRCVGNRIEVPFMMLPQAAQDPESQASFNVTESNAQRWKKIGESLLAEADNWKSSDAEFAMRKAENRKSIMVKCLENLSKVKMPVDLEEIQSGKRMFGVIDVIVTAGIANVPKNVATLVLKEPRRLLSQAPIGKDGILCGVDMDTIPKKKPNVPKQEPASVENTVDMGIRSKKGPNVTGQEYASVKDASESLLDSEMRSRNTRSSRRAIRGTDDIDPKAQISKLRPFEAQQRALSGTSLRPARTTSKDASTQTHWSAKMEHSRVKRENDDHQAPFRSTRSRKISDLNPQVTQREAVIKLCLPSAKLRAISNGTQDNMALPPSTASQDPDELGIVPPSPKRRRQSRLEDTSMAKSTKQNTAQEKSTRPSSHGSQALQAISNIPDRTLPELAAPPRSSSTLQASGSGAANADLEPAWKPSSLSNNSVLTFGSEVYNTDNYKIDKVTGLACRQGSLQEREALFGTTGVLMATRFVVNP